MQRIVGIMNETGPHENLVERGLSLFSGLYGHYFVDTDNYILFSGY